MAKKNRDDFTEKTKLQIAKRAGWLCSYPSCRTPTIGATSDGQGDINIGTAAHIRAAARGGPRYDPDMLPEERSSANNGIWMCRDHGKAIDSNDPEFTVERLRDWKRQAEEDSWRRVLRNGVMRGPAVAVDVELVARVGASAEADLDVFRHRANWPSTRVALTLEVDGFGEPVTTSALASVVTSLDDLILVAPPGMGKTTTLFQIAEGVLANGTGTPLVVPLGDWATEGSKVLASILSRPAFRGISEDEFRATAAKPGVVLLLDGWNELDADARARARVQVETLKAELPELGLVISTRRQALDVPFVGARVDLLPLSDDQQMHIATAMRGEAGAKIVDEAWRTAGIRELVTIPLYLTALLSLPENAPFPKTKEQVLRHFVIAHEKEARRAEALRAVTQGFQQDYLDGLSVFATRTANTAIAESSARRSISDTETQLVANGQITIKPQPDAVLDVLVSNHVLMRAGDTLGYSFQHQQFQEWYASHSVERRIMAEAADPVAREALKAEVFNLPAWEEAILFAVERLARGDAQQQAACSKAILAAFEVDPILAAEMVSRSTEEVWEQIASTIQDLVTRWHASGKGDRALRFMLTSGRSEFFDVVWPLITDANDQISLRALRNCRRFQPSILGKDAKRKITALPPKVRTVVLHEIASRSGMDGLDLAASIAKDDPDPEAKATVVDAFAFRRADHHVDKVLRAADEKTFDLVVRKGIIDTVADEHVSAGLDAARERQRKEGISTYDQLRAIVYARDDEDRSSELTAVIADMEIDKKQDANVGLLFEARSRYSRAVADGLLLRVRAGRDLFYGSADILAAAEFSLEEDELVEIALADNGRHDYRDEAAASVLGPEAVGRMIGTFLEAKKRIRDADGRYNKAAADRYHDLRSRLAHTSGSTLIAAIRARSAQARNDEMAELAELIYRHPNGENDRGRPFDTDTLAAIGALAEDWGNRMLASSDAARSQLASIATLASCAPSVALLPLLRRLLDDNLRRYIAFREEANAAGWHPCNATNEARSPHTHEYLRAFQEINAPETAALMREYLADEHFGQLAALVLSQQWCVANEPTDEERFFLGGVDFSRVEEKRAARTADPAATSAEAEAIFSVIESFISDEATDDQKEHAVALGVVAARLPHGKRGPTIQKLLSLASRRSCAALLENLVLSGETIDVEMVRTGIAEVLEAAKTEKWILSQDGYQLKELLRLLPFTNSPADTLAVIRGLPNSQRRPEFLEQMIAAFGEVPSNDSENILFQLAEGDPSFYDNYAWRDAVVRMGTVSAARRFVDVAANGKFNENGTDHRRMANQIGVLIAEHPELRTHVYDLLALNPPLPGLALLALAIAEQPDAKGLLLLIKIEIEHKQSFTSWRTIEKVVTEHVPAENWEGAYDVLPVSSAELRRKLLDLTTDGGPMDVAARCLRQIDKIRDRYDAPESDPRHPDLASGKPWPIITPEPDKTTQG